MSSHDTTPTLDERLIAEILLDLQQRVPAYLPAWLPEEQGGSAALLQIYARYLQALSERLNRAPDKNKLAFLDMLGINLLPDQPARAPLVFAPLTNVGDGRVQSQAQVAATDSESGEQLIFETEKSIGLAAARLAEVVSVVPAKDGIANHTAAHLAGESYTLFDDLEDVPHELYLAHPIHFALSGAASVEIKFELARGGSEALDIAWEYWDGEVWRSFAEFSTEQKAGYSFDGTSGLQRSGTVQLEAVCSEPVETTVNGRSSAWIRARLDQTLPLKAGQFLPQIERIQVRTTLDVSDLEPDSGFADTLELDFGKSIYPLGQQASVGNTFFLASEEAFGRPGASVTLNATDVLTPIEEDSSGTAATTDPTLVAEYWNGSRWQTLSGLTSSEMVNYLESGTSASFTVPSDIEKTTVNNTEGVWLRMRVKARGFNRKRTIQWKDDTNPTNTLVVIEGVPPALAEVKIDYTYQSDWTTPEHCLTYNDFQWEDNSEDARWRGASFEPFSVIDDRTPTLYLGFDRPLPADLVSLYFDVQEVVDRLSGPALVWEYWDNTSWRPLTTTDETADMVLPGMLELTYPGLLPQPNGEVVLAEKQTLQLPNARQAARFRVEDLLLIGDPVEPEKGELVTVTASSGDSLTTAAPLAEKHERKQISLALLPRFGLPRTWIRARYQQDGTPLKSELHGIYVNAVWAAQTQTHTTETLGSSNGQKSQVVFFRNTPVLGDEVVEVRELSGPRAAVELPILLDELTAAGLEEDIVRTVTDRRTGQISEVWVRWERRDNFYFSLPADRHYVLERSQGRLLFGDGQFGRIPPAGTDNILAASYRSGGGSTGNVAADQVTELLSGALAESVTNPRAAEGGADGEAVEAVAWRGPRVTRHRVQALSLSDYEALAKEASPAVAVARAVPLTDNNGRYPAVGWVKLIIMPQSGDPRPQPSFELRRKVKNYLAARVPATIAARISVEGPTYLPVGVEAAVKPISSSQAGPMLANLKQELATFLHPLTGGPEGTGWPFGRDVYLSDVAALCEGVSGVDYLSTLELLLNDTPVGEKVDVPPDRIVVAGTLRLSLV